MAKRRQRKKFEEFELFEMWLAGFTIFLGAIYVFREAHVWQVLGF